MNDQLDPRVQEELERLNEASDVINQLENKLSDTRNEYRNALSESTAQLNALTKKLGDCVSKARPYYDAKQLAKNAQSETHLAAVRFERAVSMHAAAREMVAVAEQGMENGGDNTDTAWQEMLNHATLKVNDAELERLASGEEHQEKMEKFKLAESNVSALQKKLKFNIARSKKYFDLKEQAQSRIQSLVNRVKSDEVQLVSAKQDYSQALRNLESISNSIHEARKSLGKRESGVGAEDEPTVTENNNVDVNEAKKHQYSSDLDKISPVFIDEASDDDIAKPHENFSSTIPHSKTSELLLSVADLGRVQVS